MSQTVSVHGNRTGHLVLTLVASAFIVNSVAAQAPAQGPGKILYSLDFENDKMVGDDLRVSDKKAFRFKRDGAGLTPKIVYDPLAKSNVLVVNIDPTPKGKPKDRSELQLYSGIDFNRTWAVQMRVFIPRAKTGDQWQSFAQCPQGDAPRPALTVKLNTPDKIEIVARSDKDDYVTLVSTAAPINRWFVMELEFRLGRDGGATLWIDDQKVGSSSGSIGFEAAGQRCNFKVGTYRGPTSTPFEIRFDDIKLADSHQALHAGR